MVCSHRGERRAPASEEGYKMTDEVTYDLYELRAAPTLFSAPMYLNKWKPQNLKMFDGISSRRGPVSWFGLLT